MLAIAFAGSLFVQAVMVPLLWVDLDDAPAGVRVPLVVIVFLGIVTMQVTGVCVWRLLTMVRTGTVFSPAAFRYVDVVIGAIAAASVLTFGIAVVAAPGEAVAPGVVLLICGVSLVVAGIALIANLPELARIERFAGFKAFDPGTDGLGNLGHPLSPLEALGVWPTSDFRVSAADAAA